MAVPPIYRDPLDGTEMVRVLKDGRWYMAPTSAVASLLTLPPAIERRLAALEAADRMQAARDAAQDAAQKGETEARTAADAGSSTRLGALEARPEEVAHFAAKAALPNVAVAGSFTLRLTDLVPERTGDTLRKGEQVDVRPPADLPTTVTMGIPLASADGVVTIPMKATAVVTAGAPIAWSITVLR